MNLSDLPEIKIVRHLRATRLRLRVEPTKIRLTAPTFCTAMQIQQFIESSTPWLIQSWQQQQQKIGLKDRTLPTRLKLFNLDQPLSVQYQPQKQAFILDQAQSQLYIADHAAELSLKNFVIAYAKQYLPLYLQQISTETGLKFNQCNIRQAKTRWGSCSAKHDIMLNSALVLCSLQMTRYVCVHELAHTQYFDHSPAFWHQVMHYDTDYQQHQKSLKTVTLPFWWY